MPGDQRSSDMMRQTIAHPVSGRTQTPAHNPRAKASFPKLPTGRFDMPKPPPDGVYTVPGPGAYGSMRQTRRGAHTLTNSAKPTFGKEEQRPDIENMSSRSPGPVYDTLAATNSMRHEPPKYSMSPRLWPGVQSPRLSPYEPPLGKLPEALGRQVEGERASAPSFKFSQAPQRPAAIGGKGSKQFLGKELEFVSRGVASVQVPNYISHQTNGLWKSTKQTNSPRFGFSKESRF